jgi:hypothetical protein
VSDLIPGALHDSEDDLAVFRNRLVGVRNSRVLEAPPKWHKRGGRTKPDPVATTESIPAE